MGLKKAEKLLKKTRANPTNFTQWWLLRKFGKKEGTLKIGEATPDNRNGIDLSEFYNRYEQLLRRVDFIVQSKLPQTKEIDITRCCTNSFSLSPIEAIYLNEKVNIGLSSKERKKVIDDAAAASGSNSGGESTTIPHNETCPLYGEEGCMLPQHRPLQCRIRGVEFTDEQLAEISGELTRLSNEIFYALFGLDSSSPPPSVNRSDAVSGKFIQQYFQFLANQKIQQMIESKSVEKATNRKLVMIVDDEPDMLSMLELVIKKKCNCNVVSAASGLIALSLLKEHSPDVVISDIKMPDLDGLGLLSRIREHDPSISVVIMTGYGTIDMAVQSLKEGAYDFLQKPFDKDHIVRVVNNCLERTLLLRTNKQLKEKISTLSPPQGFVGQGAALTRALDLIIRVADTDATVLIRGESGTGKEVAARALHSLSNRRLKKMITVNCPALPEHVLESELFGYSKGAFTGANHEKKGAFS